VALNNGAALVPGEADSDIDEGVRDLTTPDVGADEVP